MLETMMRWNRWGSATLSAGIEREITSKLEPFLDSPEVVALIGPRRAGKTTVLFQTMDLLEKQGVPKEAMLHINLEEPALSPQLSTALLDKIFDTFREEIYPVGKAYLFLDEIQNVPEWERWVRARNDIENIKLFITGSSSQLMSRELGTLLTGRHVSFQVFPLSFIEFLRFRSIEIPQKLYKTTVSPELRNAFNSYLRWGGFPEVVLAESDERKEVLLKQYFDDILFKDVAMRHNIRDIFALRDLAVYLLTHSGSLVSFQRLSKIFEVSLDLARSYCKYLEEAFLVGFVPFYSRKAAERQRNPHKVYAVDLGLRNAVSLSSSEDNGHLLETAVYHALQQTKNDGIFYWKKTGEVDFAIKKANTIYDLIQVVAKITPDSQTLDREVRALAEAKEKFPQAKKSLILGEIPPQEIALVTMTPIWQFLLNI